MSNINFQNGKWWELSFSFALPHMWFKLGWQVEEPTSKDRSFLVQIFLGFIAINIEWGDEDWWFEGDE
jgi:hypothetical protein